MLTTEEKTELKDLVPELLEMQSEIELLRKRCIEVASKIKKTYVWTSAKVYDVSWYCFKQVKEDFPELSEEDIDNNFNHFCEDEWYLFEEYMKEKKVYTKHLGRTSTFCITDKALEEFDPERIEENSLIDELIDNHYYTNLKEFVENHYETFRHYEGCSLVSAIEDYLSQMDIMLSDGNYELDRYESSLKDVKPCYDYLNKFMKNQVENFKYYLENTIEYYIAS